MSIYATLRTPMIALALAACAAFVCAAVPVHAQATQEDESIQLLDNFVHYALVAKPDLAIANARKLLDSGITDAELALLLDEGRVTLERFERAISWAQFVPELEEIAGELSTRVERGRLDMARDSNRIEEAVNMLTGTQRQRLIAQRRLLEAGEYAVPALLRQITKSRDQRLALASVDLIRQIGPQAVMPLCEALPHIGNATAQRVIVDLLGDLGYPHAAPFLMELTEGNNASSTARDAAGRALSRLGAHDQNASLSDHYSRLARQYFDGAESLVAFPLEATNNVWSYDQVIGLTPTAVPTEIYGQVMAMRMARRALNVDQNNMQAVSLFVAANLKRQNDLPQGAVDPIFGDADYSPDFYATVYGTRVSMDVLSLALDIQDTQLIRDAIAALGKTTGGSNLFAYDQDRQPLLEAMRYPDRRVQYEAALTLARALPTEGFASDYTVVPLLASAIRAGGSMFALVIGEDEEDRRDMATRLSSLGFDIVGSGPSVAEVRSAIDHAVGIDFVMIRMHSADRARTAVAELRIVPQTAVVPTLVLADASDVPVLRMDHAAEQRVAVSRPGLSGSEFEAVVDQLMQRAVGGMMTEAEAEVYAIEAIAVLRDIALSNSQVYDIGDAEVALIDALANRSGGLRLLIADILALMDSDQAQQELFDAALAATDSEQIELLKRVADSVKRFGNRSQDRHVNALIHLVVNSTGRTAEAAAQVHGALNLPPASAIRLIVRDN